MSLLPLRRARGEARSGSAPERGPSMGSPARAVTAARREALPKLQIRGIERLRVIDASAMPTITSDNTNSPTLTIA